MSTPSEIARYTPIISSWLPTMIVQERGDWCAYTDHLAARAADAKEIERLHKTLELAAKDAENHYRG